MEEGSDQLFEVQWLSLEEQHGATGGTLDSEFTGYSTSFSVASYNILAQHLIKRALYPSASSKALRGKNRKKLLGRDFGLLNADVVCLQEFDDFVFWPAELEKLGYASATQQKSGKSDGLAIFWKKDRFKLLHKSHIEMDDLAREPGSHPDMGRGNIALFAVLEMLDGGEPCGKGVIVSNTHLFWRPWHSWVRLRQSVYLQERLKSLDEEFHFPTVSCGDWNILPNNVVFGLLTSRGDAMDDILASHPDETKEFLIVPDFLDPESERELYLKEKFSNPEGDKSKEPSVPLKPPKPYIEDGGDPNKKSEKMAKKLAELDGWLDRLRCLSRYHSLYSGYPKLANVKADIRWEEHPPFTVVTDSFRGTVDHVFLRECDMNCNIKPLAMMRLASEEAVTKQVSIPSDYFPSDHIPVMVRLALQ